MAKVMTLMSLSPVKPILIGILLVYHFHLYAGSIIGTVNNAQSGLSIPGVTIKIVETEIVTYSDSLGAFRLDSLNPGTYSLFIFQEGFTSQLRNDIYVPGAGTKIITIDLVPEIVTLDKIVVEESSFYRSPDMSSSTKIINADELLRAPGAMVDVQRVVQNLPSVTSGGDNVNEVVVRGGNPGENLLVMDNIDIPNANHFADQSSGGGVVSLINPLLVKALTFSAGAPPAKYGGKASSVIDVTLRDGNDIIILGGVDIGMAGAGGHIEGPLWPGANFFTSGHWSYLDFIAAIDETYPVPKYWGIQSKLAQKIRSHKFSLNGIYGKNKIFIENLRKQDNMHFDGIKSGGIVYAGGFNWDAQWSDKFSTLMVVSGTGNTFDRLTFNPSTPSSPADTFYFGDSWSDEQTIKTEAAMNLDNNNRMSVGLYLKRAKFKAHQWEKPDTLKNYEIDTVFGIPVLDSQTHEPVVYNHYTNSLQTAYHYGGYFSMIWHTLGKLRMVPGIRFDRFTYNESFTISPRFNMIFGLSENFDITAAFALQYQEPDYIDLLLDSQNQFLKPKKVITGIVGGEYYFNTLDIKLITEIYFKHYSQVAIDYDLITADIFDESDRLVNKGKGHAWGIEFFAQKKLTKSFFTTLATALSKSVYQDYRPGHEDEWYDGDYDFKHSFTITGGWMKELIKSAKYKRNFHDKLWFKLLSPIMPIADRLEVSAKWRYLSGRPYTEFQYNSKTYKRWYLDPQTPLNHKHHRPYHRFDLRFERRYGFGFLHMIYYLDLQNVYNRKNLWSFLYPEYEHANPNKPINRVVIEQIPRFFSGGLIIGF